jgi:hypothetical protein
MFYSLISPVPVEIDRAKPKLLTYDIWLSQKVLSIGFAKIIARSGDRNRLVIQYQSKVTNVCEVICILYYTQFVRTDCH